MNNKTFTPQKEQIQLSVSILPDKRIMTFKKRQ